jgi:hypothetical protein
MILSTERSPIINNHQYWSVVTDLHNVLSHRSVALDMLVDVNGSMSLWLQLMRRLHGE